MKAQAVVLKEKVEEVESWADASQIRILTMRGD